MKKYDLDRFLKEQRYMYNCALQEMKSGRKQSHWMWYIFPQLKGLGFSEMASYYGIDDIDEAKAYIEHPILGSRLREISEVLLGIDESDPRKVFGIPDNMKLKSCMTLFSKATEDNKIFIDVISKFFNGEEDKNTLMLLSGNFKFGG